MRGERAGHSLDPTAVVHEAWLKMKGVPGGAADPQAFRALAGKLMRQILVDHARKRGALKRGGLAGGDGALREPLSGLQVSSAGFEAELLDLEAALAKLIEESPRRARVVELRFFGGLSSLEAAGELGVSEDTVKRDWRLARAWLNRELNQSGGEV